MAAQVRLDSHEEKSIIGVLLTLCFIDQSGQYPNQHWYHHKYP